MKRALLCAFAALLLAPVHSSPAIAQFHRELTITSTTFSTLSNVQALVELTPDNFDYSHIDPQGTDVRFTDSDQQTPISWYCEHWNYFGTSTFWVMIPSLPYGPKTLHLFYDTNGDSFTPTLSNFSGTFPHSYFVPPPSSGIPLQGPAPWEATDWFEADYPVTLTATTQNTYPGTFFVVARRIIITGGVDLSGQGHPSSGPGAGTPAPTLSTGGGGGGHIGVGGAGGSQIGGGGSSYGDATDVLGSAGGSSFDQPNSGGAGGGSIYLRAQRLDVSGGLLANGTPGSGNVSGGGGGSGGTIRLEAHDLHLQGEISARGGNGGGLTPGATSNGGGGGGGQIQIFHETSALGTPLFSTDGGSAGTGGPFPQPQAGAAGTIDVETGDFYYFGELEAVVGPEAGQVSVLPPTDAPLTNAISFVRPNPFTTSTELGFSLARPEHVAVEVFDVTGKLVSRILDRELPAGSHQAHWDGRRVDGRSAPNGVYYVRVAAAGLNSTRKVLKLQ